MSSKRLLLGLRESVLQCSVCTHLLPHVTQKVFGRGNPDARIVLVGEAPGEDEDAAGLPFVGATGELLDQMLTAAGMLNDELYICNAIKCRSWSETGTKVNNRTPNTTEITNCQRFLRNQLEIIRPDVVVGMGSVAMSALTGIKLAETRITKAAGMSEFGKNAWYLWTYHPSYVLHRGNDARLKAQIAAHLRRAKELLHAPKPAV